MANQDATYQPHIRREDGGNTLVVGASGVVKDYRGQGTHSTATGVTTVDQIAAVKTTTITLASATVPIVDSGSSGASGNLLLYTFPAGKICLLGGNLALSAVTIPSTVGTATAVLDVGVGYSSASGKTGAASGNGTLTTAAYVNVLPKADMTLSSRTGSAYAATAVALTSADGTSTAKKAYLNIAGTAATISGAGNASVTGTITLHWFNVGDD